MFGTIGLPELLVILIIAFLVFGPKKLPEVGRSIGRALREFRKASDEIKGRIEDEIQADEFRDIKKDFNDIRSTRFDLDPDKDKNKKQKDPYAPPSKEPGQKKKKASVNKDEKPSGSSSESAEDSAVKLEDHGEAKNNS